MVYKSRWTFVILLCLPHMTWWIIDVIPFRFVVLGNVRSSIFFLHPSAFVDRRQLEKLPRLVARLTNDADELLPLTESATERRCRPKATQTR